MSIAIMTRVWELDLPQSEKLIALAFADHANDDGESFPSIQRIAWKSGYSERQARAIVAKLRKRGVLERIDSGAGGRGLHTRYRIHPENAAKIACFSKSKNPVAGRRKTLKPRAENPEATRRETGPIHMEPSLTVSEPFSAQKTRGKKGASDAKRKNRAEQRLESNLAAAGY